MARANHSWSDLPTAILNLITQLLSYYDFVRFGAVCKTWQQAFVDGVAQGRRETYLPWLIEFGCFNHMGQIFSIMDLSDPLSKQTTTVGNIIKEDVRELFVGSKLCASNYGWLLFSKKLKVVEDGSSTMFFFYNPFRNKTIQLSSPLKSEYYKFKKHIATFTASPTAPRGDECAIFVLAQRFNDVYILCTYNLRDRRWSIINTTQPIDDFEAKEMAYTDGNLFCIFESMMNSDTSSMVGAFNIDLKFWDLIDCCDIQIKKSCSNGEFRTHYHLVQVSNGNGKVYLLVDHSEYGSYDCSHHWHAMEYDGSYQAWFEIESCEKVFENLVLFRNPPSVMAMQLPRPVDNDQEYFWDKYFARRRLYYDFEFVDNHFTTNCQPLWDIIKGFARSFDFLTRILIQLVPEVGPDHEYTDADDDIRMLSPTLVNQPASLLIPVKEEGKRGKEMEREMEMEMEREMEMEMEMERKRVANIDMLLDFAMDMEREREMEREMEMEMEMEMARKMERDVEMQWMNKERERERDKLFDIETEMEMKIEMEMEMGMEMEMEMKMGKKIEKKRERRIKKR